MKGGQAGQASVAPGGGRKAGSTPALAASCSESQRPEQQVPANHEQSGVEQQVAQPRPQQRQPGASTSRAHVGTPRSAGYLAAGKGQGRMNARRPSLGEEDFMPALLFSQVG